MYNNIAVNMFGIDSKICISSKNDIIVQWSHIVNMFDSSKNDMVLCARDNIHLDIY